MRRTVLKIVAAVVIGGTLIQGGNVMYQDGFNAGHNSGQVYGYDTGLDHGEAVNRVTPSDLVQYNYCMADYNDANHCYEDIFASWQK
jgi:hypothetical protein